MANQVFETQTLTWASYLRNAMLACLATRPAAALWPTPKIHLSKDPTFDPQVNSDRATLLTQECDFTGYASQTPVLAGPYNSGPLTQIEVATALFVAITAVSFVGNAVYGYWLDDGTNYLGGEKFGSQNAINIVQAGDYVQIDLKMPLGSTDASR